MKKLAAYIRVSSASQEDNTSLDHQLSKIKSYCETYDYQLIEVYKDVASGKDIKKRKDLNRLLSEINNYDGIIVFKIDRFARSLLNATFIIKQLQDLNKILISVSESFDLSTPAGRLQCNMLMSFAEYERELIRDRIKAGKDETKDKGGFLGGVTRLGYKSVRKNNISVIEKDTEEYELVKIIKNHRRAGKSFNSIAKYLNENGYKTKLNKLFTPVQVKRVLEYEQKQK